MLHGGYLILDWKLPKARIGNKTEGLLIESGLVLGFHELSKDSYAKAVIWKEGQLDH